MANKTLDYISKTICAHEIISYLRLANGWRHPNWCYTTLSRKILVVQLLSASYLGLYAAALKVAMVMSLPISAFQQAFGPYIMATFRNPDAIHLYNLVLKVFLLGVCFVAIFLAGFAENILILLAGEKYADGHVIIFPLAIAALFQAIALFIGVGTILSKNTYIRFMITFLSVLLTISVTFLLVPEYGVLGVAIGIVMGKLVLLFLESYAGNRLWPLQWDYKFIVLLTIPALVLG